MKCHRCGTEIELGDLYSINHKFFCKWCFNKKTGAGFRSYIIPKQEKKLPIGLINYFRRRRRRKRTNSIKTS